MRKIYIKRIHKNAKIPKYAYKGDVGFDFASIFMHSIEPGEVEMVHTGLLFKLEDGYEMTVRQRRGLSIIYPNYIAIGIGTVDTSYRGEIIIPIVNNNKDNKLFTIYPGDRIAQGIISPIIIPEIIEVDKIYSTNRGSSGFGSTGIKEKNIV